jgi:hypothetical protein
MTDIPNDCLSAGVHMDMLHPYLLLALTPFFREGFDLHGVGAHEFGCQVAEYVQPFDAVRCRRAGALSALSSLAHAIIVPPIDSVSEMRSGLQGESSWKWSQFEQPAAIVWPRRGCALRLRYRGGGRHRRDSAEATPYGAV